MHSSNQKLRNIYADLNELLKQKEAVNSEKEELKRKVEELERKLILQKNTIEQLEEKSKFVKIAERISYSGGDTKELKLKINEYLRELDRCMELLGE